MVALRRLCLYVWATDVAVDQFVRAWHVALVPFRTNFNSKASSLPSWLRQPQPHTHASGEAASSTYSRERVPRMQQPGGEKRPVTLPRPVPAAGGAAAAASSSEARLLVSDRLAELLAYCELHAQNQTAWPESQFLRVRGVNVHYKDSDPGGSRTKGQPVFVLLHGLSASTASWDEVMPALAKLGRVIAFDRPGFGRTERVLPVPGLPWALCPHTLGENPYTAAFTTKILFGLTDRLAVDNIVLIAHSLGAQIAMRAAQARPDSVRAMVLCAPALLNPMDRRGGNAKTVDLLGRLYELFKGAQMVANLASFNVQLRSTEERALEIVRTSTLSEDLPGRVRRNFHNATFALENPRIITKYIQPLRELNWDKGLVYFYRALQQELQFGEQYIAQVREVWQGPVLVIAGQEDMTVPLHASTRVAEEMEGSLVVFHGCAHIPMDEKAEDFSQGVSRFVKSPAVQAALAAKHKGDIIRPAAD